MPLSIDYPTQSVVRGDAGAFINAIESSLDEVSQPCAILLHYTPCGYAHFGCPVWLCRAVRSLCARWPIAMFVHEISSPGRPWRSSFWLHPARRQVMQRMLTASTLTITSTDHMAVCLRLRHEANVTVLGIPSSVGEPLRLCPLSARKRDLVIFGSPLTRRRAYAEGGQLLKEAVRALGIERVLDVGPDLRARASECLGAEFVQRGLLAQPELSHVLGNSLAGFLDYAWMPLAKSSVLAAYASHGMVPVVSRGMFADGLLEGENILDPRNLASVTEQECEEVAERAREWYLGHSIQQHAQRVADFVGR